MAGELQHREREQEVYEFLADIKARREKEARRLAQEETRLAEERRRSEAQARVDRLLGEAGAFRQASDIRDYVRRLRESASAGGELSLERIPVWAGEPVWE